MEWQNEQAAEEQQFDKEQEVAENNMFAKYKDQSRFVFEVLGSSIASERVIEALKFFFSRCPLGVC